MKGIIHFAAFKSVPESVREPGLYYRNNIVSLLNVLEAAGAHRVPHFIFSSSCSVYGNLAELPVREDSPLGQPESPYAHTKQVGERIVQAHADVMPELNAISTLIICASLILATTALIITFRTNRDGFGKT